MNGPHRLTTTNVHTTVEDRTGVYLLSNSRSGPIRYIGMSTDLRGRLQEWTERYTYFRYEYQSSQTAAYKREAGLYHYHGGKDELENEQHPPRPHQQVVCPSCAIHG